VYFFLSRFLSLFLSSILHCFIVTSLMYSLSHPCILAWNIEYCLYIELFTPFKMWIPQRNLLRKGFFIIIKGLNVFEGVPSLIHLS